MSGNRPLVEFFGYLFAPLTSSEVVAALIDAIRLGVPQRAAVVNVATFMWSRGDPALAEFYHSCDLLIPDGMGIHYASRLLGAPTAGSNAYDIADELLRRAAEMKLRIFLLGAERSVVELLASRLPALYPGLQVVGRHDGFFKEDDEASIAAEIASRRPAILLIGMPSPKKEMFVKRNQNRIGVPVALGVGGVFDIMAGVRRLAPRWVRLAGMEWLYRMLQEPRRLFRRYLTTNTAFLVLVIWTLAVRGGKTRG